MDYRFRFVCLSDCPYTTVFLFRGSASSVPLLPALRLIIEKGEEATAYEFKYGQVPSVVEPPNFDLFLQNVDKVGP